MGKFTLNQEAFDELFNEINSKDESNKNVLLKEEKKEIKPKEKLEAKSKEIKPKEKLEAKPKEKKPDFNMFKIEKKKRKTCTINFTEDNYIFIKEISNKYEISLSTVINTIISSMK